MENKKKIILKIGIFVVIASLVFSGLNIFFQRDWNAEAVNIYDEPENTVETLFVGSSMTEFGIDVMTLYEKYGICAYNLGNSGQPVLGSSFWLEEAYKYQSESLKTVVFDVSIMRTQLRTSYYRTATENMKLSGLKYEAVDAYAKDLNQTISYLFPVLSYHSKWNELTSEDFGVPQSMLYEWSRGQCFSTDTAFELLTKDTLLTFEYDVDESAECVELDDEGLEYFERMLKFCKEKDLNLILIKTPNPLTWSSSEHNTFKALSKEYGVEFIDFNFEPYTSEISYDCLLDSMDGIHLNYYGAEKLATWFGNYLIQNGYAHDVRGDEKYAFMEDEVEEYKNKIEYLVRIRECIDPVEYLKMAIQKENYTIYISVKNDAVSSLTEEQRAAFADMGLNKLSQLTKEDTYVAVIDAGKLVCEKSNVKKKVSYNGELDNGALYTIESTKDSDGKASLTIEGAEYVKNENGINIVIYDEDMNSVVDSAVFHTDISSVREVAVETILKEQLENVSQGDTLPEYLDMYQAYLELCEGEK